MIIGLLSGFTESYLFLLSSSNKSGFINRSKASEETIEYANDSSNILGAAISTSLKRSKTIGH